MNVCIRIPNYHYASTTNIVVLSYTCRLRSLTMTYIKFKLCVALLDVLAKIEKNDIDPVFFSSKNSLNIGYCLQYNGCINISKGNDIDPGCFFLFQRDY